MIHAAKCALLIGYSIAFLALWFGFVVDLIVCATHLVIIGFEYSPIAHATSVGTVYVKPSWAANWVLIKHLPAAAERSWWHLSWLPILQVKNTSLRDTEKLKHYDPIADLTTLISFSWVVLASLTAHSPPPVEESFLAVLPATHTGSTRLFTITTWRAKCNQSAVIVFSGDWIGLQNLIGTAAVLLGAIECISISPWAVLHARVLSSSIL